jgi:hypothetical protein
MYKQNSLKTRLITAQGPSQLINVIGVLHYLAEKHSTSLCEDILVLGGFETLQDDHILAACLKISSGWLFRKIVHLNGTSYGHQHGSSDMCYGIKNIIGHTKFDEVFVCRNWQQFNKNLLRAYSDASVICYGDGYGIVDIETSEGARPRDRHGPLILPSAVYMHIPVIWYGVKISTIPNIHLETLPWHYLKKALYDQRSVSEEFFEYCIKLGLGNASSLSLATTSNYTESGCMKKNPFQAVLLIASLLLSKLPKWVPLAKHCMSISTRLNAVVRNQGLKAEINMYVAYLARYLLPKTTLLIKSHPRESLNQSEVLAHRLRKNGYCTITIDEEFRWLPVELLMQSPLQVENLFCLGSQSCLATLVVSKNMSTQVHPDIDRDIKSKFMVREQLRNPTAPLYEKISESINSQNEELEIIYLDNLNSGN